MSEYPQGECWRNAWNALYEHPGARYVEGWCVKAKDAVTFEHGWIEVDGAVVDVTLPADGQYYFPGLVLTAEEARKALAADPRPGLELPIAWGGDFPKYRAAFAAAMLKAEELLRK